MYDWSLIVMKKNTLFTSVLSLIILASLYVPSSYASPDYDLLIITPEEFIEEIFPLKMFKLATGRPTITITLEDIYARYVGVDKAEQVKRCIAEYESIHNIKYVLLFGDVDKVPIRYFTVQHFEDGNVSWWGYYMTDHYYADLYRSGGGFCDWNDDGDEYFAETAMYGDSKNFVNVDGIDFEFDVIVGRVPASTEVEVTNYVNKLIQYEMETLPTDAWFRKIMLVSGVGSSIYPDEIDYSTDPGPYSDLVQLDKYATTMESVGYSSIKLYHNNPNAGLYYPGSDMINLHLYYGVGLMGIQSHQNQNTWGGDVYNFPGDMGLLFNDGKYPIIYSQGCASAKIGPIGPNEDYMDTSGVLQNYGYDYSETIDPWVDPEPPNVLQQGTDQGAIPEYLLVSHPDKGSVAYIGFMAESIPLTGNPVGETLFQSIADGENVLGEVWRDVGEHIFASLPLSTHWESCRRWLFINVFGDPSLHIGGLVHKPRDGMTSLDIGPPYYVDGTITYVKGGTTQFTIIKNDIDCVGTYYLAYPTDSPHGVWQAGPQFTISGDTGEYTVWYTGEDTFGYLEYPMQSVEILVDSTAPVTTPIINDPMKIVNSYYYVTSDSDISLISFDSESGVWKRYYSINDGDYVEYLAPFNLPDVDGSYNIKFYSFDNVLNREPTQEIDLIVDTTNPDVSISVGTPKVEDDILWVNSLTEFTATASDGLNDINRIEYTLTDIRAGTTTDPTEYTEPITIPKNANNNAKEWTLEITAYDNIGLTDTESLTIWVEDRGPFSGLWSDPAYYEFGVSDYIYVSTETDFWFEPNDLDAYDRGVGVDYTEYNVNDSPWIRYAPGVILYLAGPDGLYNIECMSVDR